MNAKGNKTALILGLGNDILSDDGVGIHAARRAKEILEQEDIETGIQVLEAGVAGVALIDILTGFPRAVIIDAILNPSKEPGSVTSAAIEEFEGASHFMSAHQIDLPTAVLLAEKLGEPLPKEIFVVAVTAKDVTSFAENCTPPVAAAIEPAARLAIELALGRVT